MTLASDSRKTSSERFAHSNRSFGERAHAATLPPTLLRLPSLSSSVTNAVAPTAAHAADCEPKHHAAEPQILRASTEPSVTASQSVDATIPDPQSIAPTLVSSRINLVTRAIPRDFNVAAFVDRVATRKTLSAALVVVAGLAIWMPRGGDSRSTLPTKTTGLSDVAATTPSQTSADPVAEIAMTPSQASQSLGEDTALDLELIANAVTATGIQPGFSDRMAQTKSTPMESAAIADTHEKASYDLDPMASAANDQIRRMDASYADLPSASTMNSVAFETEATPAMADLSEQNGPLNLVESRTPQPIVNWADYLPPVGAQDYSEQLASSSPTATAAMTQTVAAKPSADAIPTTSLPTAPDFGLAFPGDGELIEADAHVAMPPSGAADQAQMR